MDSDRLKYTGDLFTTMHKRPLNKTEMLTRVAHLEAFLFRLETDHNEASRKSALVSDCIKKGKEELEASITNLTENDLGTSQQCSNIAWLYFNFGRRLLDAENIEAVLGNGEFLELTENEKAPEVLLEQYFGLLDQMVLQLLAVIKERAAI